MKIVVAGALGHIGSRLIREFPKEFPGCEVIMIDNMLTQRYCSLFDLPKGVNYKFIEADVTQVELAPLMHGVDIVVHLAAITDATWSLGNAEAIEQNNFLATKRIAEACIKVGARLIVPSSTSVYTPHSSLVDEYCLEAELQPKNPYALTKLKEESLIQQLVKFQGLRACVFRFGTVFGPSPGMRFHTAVNKFCWQAVMGQSLTVWSTAYDQKRPYLDLSDACNSIIHVIRNELFDGNVYNVLTLNATVRDIVETIRIHIPELHVNFVVSQVMNDLSYEVSSAKIVNTSFTPSGSLARSLADELQLIAPFKINSVN
jgi:UDP-glucose 4-epimerase